MCSLFILLYLSNKMHNYLFTLTVNIQYNVQIVHFTISFQQMHNYLLVCQYRTHCAVCIFYYICPKNSQLSVYSVSVQYTEQFIYFFYNCPKNANLSVYSVNKQYNVQFVHLLYRSNKCTIICLI